MTAPDATFRGKADLLGPQEVRALAAELDIKPTKSLGQNFVHDANTVRRIVIGSGVGRSDTVIEVGPGLGSLTLPLLDAAGHVVAIEIDPALAGRLPRTVAERAPELAGNLTVVTADALAVRGVDLRSTDSHGADLGSTDPGVPAPTALVANLPYNISVPVLLHLLAEVPTLRTALVMVQLEVADRLAAPPGSRVYGVPSVKAGFFGTVRRTGTVGRNVFWPVPNVESGLVRIDAYETPPWDLGEAHRRRVFAVADAAFAQRRKTLRAALSGWAGSPADAELALVEADVDPKARGEQLTTADFVRIAEAARRLGIGQVRREP
ncbi:16S rRNA (adenine(1518)-N(6)/adenine(1519)-N(6))-dimethyltransferase RsmA [Rhodococcus sp. IEGM 1408]|uniref:16S rRNA (adenine(1518)-N(6)/adenine(1519)-N(6))- dimethyltransferase RsmA n=1 Tax=Rhodococcus sp. IEGM 1408 TaxID=3082220 RepID=UPI002953AF12|nr:16S rRNA (adenine(1518)-N(6)/adenine(1519)-N(6))-dimethyltransferase RsmA [Rhodococcus sp. IEGM 1408]MDV8001098.1 16S rRNA (adenine(1518)-N(6)/adenine(1519)-N(6))-dimethyltransferase RsmA [Rhodococcus sp. IEGM 1408]